MLLRFRAFHVRPYAGGISFCARTGHGRGVEYGRDTGRRDMAERATGQGSLASAEFVGDWICAGRPRKRDCAALRRLAHGVLCGSSSRTGDCLDPKRRARVRDVGRTSSAGAGHETSCRSATSLRAPQLHADLSTALSEISDRTPADELFWNVCLVGTVHLDPALSFASCRARWTRLRGNGNDDSVGSIESRRNVSGVRRVRMGGGPARPPTCIHAVYLLRGCPGAGVCNGTLAVDTNDHGCGCGFFWNRFFFRIRHHRERNLSHHRTSAGTRVHLQRSPNHEFDGAFHHRKGRTEEGPELRILSVRRCFISIHAPTNAAGRASTEANAMREISP